MLLSHTKPALKPGFTLVELSIVLVIIGLIIGGVLVGRDLISAAGVRAQISQIGKYNVAVNTFHGKYGYLPGDISEPAATQAGLTPRGTLSGNGDGNGLIEGSNGGACSFCVDSGETALFWVDLTTANGMNINLIEGAFTNAPLTWASPLSVTPDTVDQYFPIAKIGRHSSIVVWSGGWGSMVGSPSDGKNYFSVEKINSINQWDVDAGPALTVAEAYNIDTKIDDGLSQSGNVITLYLVWAGKWASGGGSWGHGEFNGLTGGPSNAPTPATDDTCYDNAGVNGGPQNYSMGQNNGLGLNCALSFKFQ